MPQHKEQQGFLTFAKNTDTVDYLQLAYVQCLNVKATQKINRYAVVVDAATYNKLEAKHHDTFDYIFRADSLGTFDNEWQAFWFTPFKETIKLEADLLFTRSIDHWWNTFRLRDVVMSTGCRDYQQNLSNERAYRRVFDDNDLPDVYNGLMYFRYSQIAHDFFSIAREIFIHWDDVSLLLKNCRTEPSTDLVYAIAARVVGEENCTLPTADFINFVHMKPAINKFSDSLKFTDVFVTEFDGGMIRINNINQYHPLHYYVKDFVTPEMEAYYARSNIS